MFAFSFLEIDLDKAALLMADRETQLVVHTALECAGLQCDVFPSTSALLRGVKREVHRVLVADIDYARTDCSTLLAWRTNWLNPEVTVIAIGSDGPWAASRAFVAGADDFIVPLRSL